MSDTPGFVITAAWSTRDVLLTVSGDLDLAATPGWDAAVNEILGQAPTSITVDLGATTFVDSSGLRLMLILTQEAEDRSVPFAAVNIPPAVVRLLEITGLTERLHEAG